MTTTSLSPATAPWAHAHGVVVVGIDGSEGSAAAAAWATMETAATGGDLRLVTAATRHRDRAEGHLRHAAAGLSPGMPTEHVSTAVYDGHPEHELLRHLDDVRLLVVGKRGRGAIARLLVGSTAVEVAGRSPVPVAVVPTGWEPADHRHQPVVVGLDPDHPYHHLLHEAFLRAQRLGVPLVVVHGTEGPQQLEDEGEDDAVLSPAAAAAHERFEAALEWWRSRFSDVEVRAVPTAAHPAMALLAESEQGAQLVVLGRRVRRVEGGFGFGSVTHAVLHYTEVPVLVVPSEPTDP